jgi:hypothetical protein
MFTDTEEIQGVHFIAENYVDMCLYYTANDFELDALISSGDVQSHPIRSPDSVR